VSVFGGPAWERHGDRFYYHAYLPEQPDLDWRRDDVRTAMLDVLRFWCERGADGFRIDALRQLFKDDRRRDNPLRPGWHAGDDPYDRLIPEFTTDRPEVQDAIRAFRETVGEERLLLGELYLPIERLVAYYASGLDMPANFHLLTCEWTAPALAELIERYEAALPEGAWPNWVLGNHDRPRVASRLGAAQAPAAAMLLTTLRGTPTLYYGDEIGMEDVDVPDPVDPWGRRDPARTPMQWGARGFSAVEPWLPYGDESVSVEAQRDDQGSLLSLYRRLLRVRREFADAPYETVSADDALVFRRGSYVVAINVSDHEAAVRLRGEVVAGTEGLVDGEVRLSAGAGLVVRELA